MTPNDDGALWVRIGRGDAGAFGIFFDRHANAIFRYCFRRTADLAAAEELVSLVFLEAWRRREQVSLDGASVLPWLYGVSTNMLRNQRRALRRYRALLERVPQDRPESDFVDDLAERLDDERLMRSILEAVSSLPQRELEVFALCVWQGLTSAEAAQALGIPEGTVRTRLQRARGRIQDHPSIGPLDPASTRRNS